ASEKQSMCLTGRKRPGIERWPRYVVGFSPRNSSNREPSGSFAVRRELVEIAPDTAAISESLPNKESMCVVLSSVARRSHHTCTRVDQFFDWTEYSTCASRR